jgi:hypothetical protein
MQFADPKGCLMVAVSPEKSGNECMNYVEATGELSRPARSGDASSR